MPSNHWYYQQQTRQMRARVNDAYNRMYETWANTRDRIVAHDHTSAAWNIIPHTIVVCKLVFDHRCHIVAILHTYIVLWTIKQCSSVSDDVPKHNAFPAGIWATNWPASRQHLLDQWMQRSCVFFLEYENICNKQTQSYIAKIWWQWR